MEELLHPEWSAEKIEQLKGHYQSILSLLGEDVEREGLLKTRARSQSYADIDTRL